MSSWANENNLVNEYSNIDWITVEAYNNSQIANYLKEKGITDLSTVPVTFVVKNGEIVALNELGQKSILGTDVTKNIKDIVTKHGEVKKDTVPIKQEDIKTDIKLSETPDSEPKIEQKGDSNIYRIEVDRSDPTKAVISYKTDIPTGTQVMICESNGMCTWSTPDDTKTTDHTVVMPVKEGEKYHYLLVSKEENNKSTQYGFGENKLEEAIKQAEVSIIESTMKGESGFRISESLESKFSDIDWKKLITDKNYLTIAKTDTNSIKNIPTITKPTETPKSIPTGTTRLISSNVVSEEELYANKPSEYGVLTADSKQIITPTTDAIKEVDIKELPSNFKDYISTMNVSPSLQYLVTNKIITPEVAKSTKQDIVSKQGIIKSNNIEDYKTIITRPIDTSGMTPEQYDDFMKGVADGSITVKKDKDGILTEEVVSYDVARYLRDNPGSIYTIANKFSSESIQKSLDYNNQPFVKKSNSESWWNEVKAKGWTQGNLYEWQAFLAKNPDIKTKAVTIYENAKANTGKQAPMSLDQFTAEYLVARGYKPIPFSSISTDPKINQLREQAMLAYGEEYGNAELLISEAQTGATLLFAPAKGLYPEKPEVTPIDWAIGGSQLAMYALPFVGGGIAKLIGATLTERVIGGVIGASGVLATTQTIAGWDEMTPEDRIVAIAMDTLMIAGATKSLIHPTLNIENIGKGGRETATKVEIKPNPEAVIETGKPTVMDKLKAIVDTGIEENGITAEKAQSALNGTLSNKEFRKVSSDILGKDVKNAEITQSVKDYVKYRDDVNNARITAEWEDRLNTYKEGGSEISSPTEDVVRLLDKASKYPEYKEAVQKAKDGSLSNKEFGDLVKELVDKLALSPQYKPPTRVETTIANINDRVNLLRVKIDLVKQAIADNPKLKAVAEYIDNSVELLRDTVNKLTVEQWEKISPTIKDTLSRINDNITKIEYEIEQNIKTISEEVKQYLNDAVLSVKYESQIIANEINYRMNYPIDNVKSVINNIEKTAKQTSAQIRQYTTGLSTSVINDISNSIDKINDQINILKGRITYEATVDYNRIKIQVLETCKTLEIEINHIRIQIEQNYSKLSDNSKRVIKSTIDKIANTVEQLKNSVTEPIKTVTEAITEKVKSEYKIVESHVNSIVDKIQLEVGTVITHLNQEQIRIINESIYKIHTTAELIKANVTGIKNRVYADSWWQMYKLITKLEEAIIPIKQIITDTSIKLSVKARYNLIKITREVDRQVASIKDFYSRNQKLVVDTINTSIDKAKEYIALVNNNLTTIKTKYETIKGNLTDNAKQRIDVIISEIERQIGIINTQTEVLKGRVGYETTVAYTKARVLFDEAYRPIDTFIYNRITEINQILNNTTSYISKTAFDTSELIKYKSKLLDMDINTMLSNSKLKPETVIARIGEYKNKQINSWVKILDDTNDTLQGWDKGTTNKLRLENERIVNRYVKGYRDYRQTLPTKQYENIVEFNKSLAKLSEAQKKKVSELFEKVNKQIAEERKIEEEVRAYNKSYIDRYEKKNDIEKSIIDVALGDKENIILPKNAYYEEYAKSLGLHTVEVKLPLYDNYEQIQGKVVVTKGSLFSDRIELINNKYREVFNKPYISSDDYIAYQIEVGKAFGLTNEQIIVKILEGNRSAEIVANKEDIVNYLKDNINKIDEDIKVRESTIDTDLIGKFGGSKIKKPKDITQPEIQKAPLEIDKEDLERLNTQLNTILGSKEFQLKKLSELKWKPDRLSEEQRQQINSAYNRRIKEMDTLKDDILKVAAGEKQLQVIKNDEVGTWGKEYAKTLELNVIDMEIPKDTIWNEYANKSIVTKEANAKRLADVVDRYNEEKRSGIVHVEEVIKYHTNIGDILGMKPEEILVRINNDPDLIVLISEAVREKGLTNVNLYLTDKVNQFYNKEIPIQKKEYKLINDKYKKEYEAYLKNVGKQIVDAKSTIMKNSEALFGFYNEELSRYINDIVSKINKATGNKKVATALKKVVDGIEKQDIKLLKEGAKLLQLEGRKDYPRLTGKLLTDYGNLIELHAEEWIDFRQPSKQVKEIIKSIEDNKNFIDNAEKKLETQKPSTKAVTEEAIKAAKKQIEQKKVELKEATESKVVSIEEQRWQKMMEEYEQQKSKEKALAEVKETKVTKEKEKTKGKTKTKASEVIGTREKGYVPKKITKEIIYAVGTPLAIGSSLIGKEKLVPLPSPEPTKTSPLVKEVPEIVPTTTIVPEPKPYPLIKEQPEPKAVPQTSPEIKTETKPEPYPKPAPIPEPEPEIKPKPELYPQTKTKPIPETKLLTKKTILPIKFINKKGKEVVLTDKQREGIVAWKQGIMYKLIYPPYGKDDIYNSPYPIKEVEYADGIRSATQSMVSRYGTIPKQIHRHMGVVDINIFRTEKEGKPRPVFEEKYQTGGRRKHYHRKPVKRRINAEYSQLLGGY